MSSVSVLITMPPIGAIVAINDDFSLTCEAEGFPIPTITWQQNGSLVDARDDVVIFSQNINTRSVRSELRISMAVGSDSGIYSCIAMNDIGEPEIAEVMMIVQGDYMACNFNKLHWLVGV